MAGRYQRLMAAPKGSFFLFGVRGIGKSTWTRAAFPDAHFIDLLDESRYQALTANPGLLALELAAIPRQRVIVLDEVQRVPELLNVVHALIEQPVPQRFVLTESSARKLRRGGVDLLGRKRLPLGTHRHARAQPRERTANIIIATDD